MTRDDERRLTQDLQRLTELAGQGAGLSGKELDAHSDALQALADSLEASLPELRQGEAPGEALREAAVHAMAANRKAIKIQRLRFKLAELAGGGADEAPSQRVDLIS